MIEKLFTCITLFLIAVSNCFATPPGYVDYYSPYSQPVLELTRRAVDDVIEQQYDSALSYERPIYYDSRIAATALHILILQSWIIDYESFDRVNEFENECNGVETWAKSMRKERPGIANLTLGFIDGFRATIAMRQEKWITAARASISMKSELEDALAADSSLTDAYVGLGSFDYWSSRKLSFLPFLGDHRQRGIERIKIALRTGRLHEASATTALIWIYIDSEEYSTALTMAEAELKKYPTARSYLWAAAEAAYAMKDWKKGIEYYLQILTSVRSDSNQNNHFNELGCYHRLADMSMKIGNRENATEFVRKGLSLKLSTDIRARKKHDLSDFHHWYEEWTGAPYRD